MCCQLLCSRPCWQADLPGDGHYHAALLPAQVTQEVDFRSLDNTRLLYVSDAASPTPYCHSSLDGSISHWWLTPWLASGRQMQLTSVVPDRAPEIAYIASRDVILSLPRCSAAAAAAAAQRYQHPPPMPPMTCPQQHCTQHSTDS